MGSFDRNLNRSQIYIGAKRGGEGEGEGKSAHLMLLPFSLPPYSLPLSTPAT